MPEVVCVLFVSSIQCSSATASLSGCSGSEDEGEGQWDVLGRLAGAQYSPETPGMVPVVG